MIRYLQRLCAVLIWTSATGTASANDSEAVQNDVRSAVSALYQGDVDTIMRYSYPPVIAAMGGEDAARAMLEAVAGKGQYMALLALDFPAEPQFLQGNGRDFVVVPVHVVYRRSNKRGEHYGFQFGIRPAGGARWTYIDGTKITPGVREAMFADLPADYSLPPTSR
ncbi:MAG: hypothetical protein H6978_10410 [Gammaproteobacteria bacterium]|nr:hypothetical protein [Gammaproteobacteria bacterium]